jgi:hypothetical protein
MESTLNIPKNNLSGHTVQLDVTASWQDREATLDLPFDPATTGTCECSIPTVKAELGVLVADEIQDGQTRFVVCESQAAA